MQLFPSALTCQPIFITQRLRIRPWGRMEFCHLFARGEFRKCRLCSESGMDFCGSALPFGKTSPCWTAHEVDCRLFDPYLPHCFCAAESHVRRARLLPVYAHLLPVCGGGHLHAWYLPWSWPWNVPRVALPSLGRRGVRSGSSGRGKGSGLKLWIARVSLA